MAKTAAILLALHALAAQAATLNFKSGATFEGKVLEVTGTNTVVVRSDKDGKTYTVNLSYLTEATQLLITGQPKPSESSTALPPQDLSVNSSQIEGAFGLKLGQVYDPSSALSTNKSRATMMSRGGFIQVDMTNYDFKPALPLPPFHIYSASVSPSNVVYEIIALACKFKSSDTLRNEKEKLYRALEEKYGEGTLLPSGMSGRRSYTFQHGTREVELSFCFDGDNSYLELRYKDNALCKEAKMQQLRADDTDPAVQAERKKLKQQL
jgi:hypothetical protein